MLAKLNEVMLGQLKEWAYLISSCRVQSPSVLHVLYCEIGLLFALWNEFIKA